MTKTKNPTSNVVCRNISLGRDTDRALREIKKGLSKCVPGLKKIHTYTFACEQAIHYCYNQVQAGKLSYRELFTVPHGEEEGETAEDDTDSQ